MMPRRRPPLFKLPPPPMPSRRLMMSLPPLTPRPGRRSLHHRFPAARHRRRLGRRRRSPAAGRRCRRRRRRQYLAYVPGPLWGEQAAICKTLSPTTTQSTTRPRSFMELNKFGMCAAARVPAEFRQSSGRVPAKFRQVPASSGKFRHGLSCLRRSPSDMNPELGSAIVLARFRQVQQ